MARAREEVAGNDLGSIEDGVVKPNCWACGQRQLRITKLLVNERGETTYATRTKNHTGACQNPACFRFLDLKKVPSWVREDAVIPNEVPRGATRSGALV